MIGPLDPQLPQRPQRHDPVGWRPSRWGRPRPRLARRHSGPIPLLALAALFGAGPGVAADSLASCNAWQHSHGVERILLGNAIGAAHYLTKRQKLLESPTDAPIALYQDSDLQRVCSSR